MDPLTEAQEKLCREYIRLLSGTELQEDDYNQVAVMIHSLELSRGTRYRILRYDLFPVLVPYLRAMIHTISSQQVLNKIYKHRRDGTFRKHRFKWWLYRNVFLNHFNKVEEKLSNIWEYLPELAAVGECEHLLLILYSFCHSWVSHHPCPLIFLSLHSVQP